MRATSSPYMCRYSCRKESFQIHLRPVYLVQMQVKKEEEKERLDETLRTCMPPAGSDSLLYLLSISHRLHFARPG